MSAKDKKRRYATIRHPTIAAAIEGTYRFQAEAQAKQQLQILREYFVLSRHQKAEDHAIILWVKGFEVTKAEKKNGYTGNYAAIGIKKLGEGKYTLSTKKVESELKFHPQRQRPQHRHPNWGHPVLRSIKKKRIYQTVELAQAELQALHEEFPEVTIPLTNKVYVIVYSRQEKPPAKKYVLEIKVADDGGFYIEATENTYKPSAAPIPTSKLPPSEDGEEQGDEAAANNEAPGYFASMVALRRSKKKKAPITVPKEDNSEADV